MTHIYLHRGAVEQFTEILRREWIVGLPAGILIIDEFGDCSPPRSAFEIRRFLVDEYVGEVLEITARQIAREMSARMVELCFTPKNAAEAGDWERRARVDELRVREALLVCGNTQRSCARRRLIQLPRCKLKHWPSLKERRAAWRIET